MTLKERWLPSIPQSLAVFVFWLLMVDPLGVANVLFALLLAFVMPLLAARLEREFARVMRVRHLPLLGLRLAWDILKANLVVARQVLGPNRRLQPQFVWVPLELANIHGISALASIITLTPGTVAASLSADRRYLLVHCLDVDDPDAMIADIKRRYEAPMLEMFPC